MDVVLADVSILKQGPLIAYLPLVDGCQPTPSCSDSMGSWIHCLH